MSPTSSSPNRPIPPLQSGQNQSAPANSPDSMPPLIDALVIAYRDSINMENEERQAAGRLDLLDAEIAIGAAQPMLAFFNQYLDTFRPVLAFAVDNNYGIQLANSTRCVISPYRPDEAPGTMQSSGAIEVTSGQSNPGQNGVVRVGPSLPIR